MRTLVTPRGPIEAVEHGAGSPRSGLAVLLHAAGTSPRALSGLASWLGERLGRAIVPLLLVPPPEGPAAPLAHLSALARDALAAGGPGPKVLFGHSLGGLLALQALADGAEVDAVILYEPIAIAALDLAETGDRAAKAWDRALIDDLAAHVSTGDPEPGIAAFIEAYNEVAWTNLPASARHALVADAPAMVALTQAVHHHPLDVAALSLRQTPTLVMCGDRSPDVAKRMASQAARILPRATLTVIPDAGHMGPLLATSRVVAAIEAFFASMP